MHIRVLISNLNLIKTSILKSKNNYILSIINLLLFCICMIYISSTHLYIYIFQKNILISWIRHLGILLVSRKAKKPEITERKKNITMINKEEMMYNGDFTVIYKDEYIAFSVLPRMSSRYHHISIRRTWRAAVCRGILAG